MNEYRSSEINLIMGALAKSQGMYKPLIANEEGPGGIFANHQATLDATREATSSNGLALFSYTQILDEGSGATLFYSILAHESGQYIGSVCRFVGSNHFRRDCAKLTQYRRIQAQLLLGIAPSSNDPFFFDDDGEIESEENLIEHYRRGKPNRDVEKQDVINKEQYENLLDELMGFEQIAKSIQEKFNIQTLADLPKDEYHKTLGKIRRIIRESEKHK